MAWTEEVWQNNRQNQTSIMFQKIDGGLLLDLVDASVATLQPEGVMLLKDDRWIMKVRDESNVLMFATRVTKEAMEEYSKTDYERLGIRFDSLKDSVFSKSDSVELEVVDHKLHVRQQGYDASLSMTDPEYVSGVAQKVPQVDWCVEAEGDLSFIKDFVKRADKILGASSFSISPRENNLYLYAEHDGEELTKKYPWSDFESVEINWDIGEDPPGSGGNVPGESKAADTILAIDYAKDLTFIDDEGTLFVDNHTPIKLLFDTREGVDASYFFSPRISNDDIRSTMPNEAADPEDQV